MTRENEQSIGAQPEERSLVVRHGDTGIQKLPEGNILQEVGFSPLLPERLRRLNDVLAPESKGTPIAGLSITMFPGRNPIIETNIRPAFAYYVNLETRGFGKASLKIVAKEQQQSGRGFMLSDIKEFARTTFPSKEARFHAYRNRSVEEREGLGLSGDFDADLLSLTQEVINPFTDFIDEPELDANGQVVSYISHGTQYRGYDIRLKDAEEPLFVMNARDRWNNKTNEKTVILHVEALLFTGSIEDVETVMDGAANLFDKPLAYPYRFIDIHPKDTENS